MTNTMREIIKVNRVWYCLDCGKCSAVCPITRWEQQQYASPRLLVERAINTRFEETLADPLFWSCLTCKQCSEICPSEVYFSEFLRDARSLAREDDHAGTCTHSGMIQSWAKMMTDPDLIQNRLGWLSDDLRVSEESDTIYFTGCLPYYDVAFEKLGVEGVEIAQAAVKIFNHLGIEPQVLADERCCGHDQLWEGDTETFRQLAERNLERLKSTGAKRIVTTCPECARTLKVDYPQLVGEHNMEVLHLTELLAESDLPYSSSQSIPAEGLITHHSITYQDPCRLGRYLDVYDAPRHLITDLGLELTEMEHARKSSLCCGTSCWTSCGQVSKNIQVERLQEAKATGADILVTACVKCQIHFKCAQDDPVLGDEIDIAIRDLTTLVAERLG
ncbi:MAG: putative iron-sulfur-binding oxidoreductase FadF [Chloroflexi bacterium]|nr:putative iron-sulfur-binding oxidoreductase FadF [Chloroflexota bacterium]